MPTEKDPDSTNTSSNRKRKTRGEPNQNAEDDDSTTKDIATSKELKLFAAARGIKDTTLRVRSVTTSIDACVREDVPGKEALVQQIDKDARSLGILRHLVSVCLNALAEKDPSNTLVVSRTFIQQLFTLISGNELNTRTKPLQHPDLESYLRARELDEETLREVRSFPLRCRDALCGEMMTSIKTHISGNFQSRATEHLSSQLERRLWDFRDDPHFWTNVPRAAMELYKGAGQRTSEQALVDLRAFTTRKRGKEKVQLRPEWREAMEQLLTEYRSLFKSLRTPVPPKDKAPEKTKTPKREVKPTGREDFLYNVKAMPNAVLGIEAEFRRVDFRLRERRGEIWSAIYERQPEIRPADTKEGFLQQKHLLRAIPVPAWFDNDVEMTKKDAGALIREVSSARKKMWKETREPGTENPPKTFSLMPYFSLTRAFVKYDSESLQTLAKSLEIQGGGDTLRTEGVKHAGRGKRLWWTGIFDFHTERTVNRRPNTRRPRTRRGRKVLRLNNRFRKGISVCTKDPWVTDDALYKKNIEDPACGIPWLVNSISTDGLQAKVCLSTISKANPIAKGVQELVKKGFTGLSDSRFKLSTRSKGVFDNKVAKLTKPERAGLCSPENHIEVVGVDPGQVSIYAMVRANITEPDKFDPTSFKGSSSSFSSREYRHQSLARFSARLESTRREQSADYGGAIKAYDSVSLKQPDSSLAYSGVTYSTLRVRVVELLSVKRRLQRFARLRARQRTVDGMARDIAFGDTYKKEVIRTQRVARARMPLEQRKELLKKIRAKKRVVFFGDGQFAHGSRGPCPRKALIRALGVICPVVLIDEFRTSKCCYGCGTPLTQVGGSRVFRCGNQTDESLRCSVGYIDRDVNGSVNIGVAGVCELLGLERPSFLCRTSTGD